jgi:predicted membrane protein
MNDLENKIEQRFGDNNYNNYQRRHNVAGRKWTGVFILLIGVVALLKNTFSPIPEWVFSWPMILIAVGFFLGVRHNFRSGAWFIPMLIGSIFLLNNMFPNVIEKRLIWPLPLIVVGAFLIFKPRRHHRTWRERGMQNDVNTTENYDEQISASDEDLIESTSIFGGTKKVILSKDFKGGDVVNIMGGTEINLSQADIQGRAVLEVTQIFGGTKIIVPSHWDVKPEMAAIFGGIDDKRAFQNVTVDPAKVLILKGTSVFGGIEVRSF